jgi:hypothetical protein
MPDAAMEVATEVTTEVFNYKPCDNARLGGNQCASA